MIETIWMVKGSDQLARGRIPKLGAFVSACRQDPGAARTELRLKDLVLVGKGGDEFARGRIPELGAVVRARRQDPSAVRTKVKHRSIRFQKFCPLVDRTMGKGGDKRSRGRIPEPGKFTRTRRQDPGAVRTERPIQDVLLGIDKGGDELARGRSPELGG